jgi:hypothetical protein
MSDPEEDGAGTTPPPDRSPEMRRGVSRRSLITDELGRAGVEAVKRLPSLAPIFGFAFRESPAHRDERLVKHLWQLMTGREPKDEERAAGLEVVRNAQTPDEKGDALVDILWALGQTKDFVDLNRPNGALVRGLYRIALDRDPSEEERQAALDVLTEAVEPPAKVAALEGLFTGLVRSMESVLRR